MLAIERIKTVTGQAHTYRNVKNMSRYTAITKKETPSADSAHTDGISVKYVMLMSKETEPAISEEEYCRNHQYYNYPTS